MTPEERADKLARGLWITPSRIITERIAKAIAAAETAAAAKAREEEREACAQVLDDLDFRPAHHDEQVQVCMEGAGADALIAAAAAIRARTEETTP